MKAIMQLYRDDSNNVLELPETSEAYKKLEKAIEPLFSDKGKLIDLLDLIGDHGAYNQLQGYIRGFQYATQIAKAVWHE